MILSDLSQFIFVRYWLLSVTSRDFFSRYASPGFNTTTPIIYCYMMSSSSFLLSSMDSPSSELSWSMSQLVVQILWVSSSSWEISIHVCSVPVRQDWPYCPDSYITFHSTDSLFSMLCCHPISPWYWKADPVLSPSIIIIHRVYAVEVRHMVR